MKPRNGENPPFINSSRSQSCRAVRSHDTHSFEWLLSSAAYSAGTCSWTSSPPCGAIRWLVEEVNSLILPMRTSVFLEVFESVNLSSSDSLRLSRIGEQRRKSRVHQNLYGCNTKSRYSKQSAIPLPSGVARHDLTDCKQGSSLFFPAKDDGR